MESLSAETGLTEVDKSEVRKIVESLKNGKVANIFGMTSEYLNLASTSLIPTLTQLINVIVGSGIIPDDLKIGLATPIPKKKKQMDPDKFK